MSDISKHALQDIRNPRGRARTQYEWKQDKRDELDTVLAAIDKYMFGSAECPDHETLKPAFRAIRDYHPKLSKREWGL